MDEPAVYQGGMLSWTFPPYTPTAPWHMSQAMPYNSPFYWYRNGFFEMGPPPFSQMPFDTVNPIEHNRKLTCNITINFATDENKVPQQQLLEGLSPCHDNKPPPNELANGDTSLSQEYLHTLSQPSAVEQSVPCKQEEASDELQHPAADEFNGANCSPSLQKQCSSIQNSATEQNHSPVVAGTNKQEHADCSIIQEPHHMLSDAIEMLGKSLNVLMAHVHDMPSNRVEFQVERKVWQDEEQPRRLSLTREEPATDPSDYDCYPEAFDCRHILQHMRKRGYLREYAKILNCPRSRDLKRDIDKILGRIPGKRASRSPRPTWASLVDTLHKMKSFIEQAVAGLRRNNEHDLAAELDKGYDNLKNIIAKAERAWQMQTCFV